MKDFKRVHFVGIGGAGMSALAKVFLQMGKVVTGSDLKESQNTLSLRKQGAEIAIGHHPKNVGRTQVVVYSSAIPSQNCELKWARQKGILLLSRGKLLAHLCEQKTTIAIAGTHGKTTATSMISMLLEKNGLDPTFLIGGELNDIGSNAKYGKGQLFVAETDESDGSFLYLRPEIVVLTNIEADHLDYYHSLENIENAFVKFVAELPATSYLIACGDHPNLKKVLQKTKVSYVSYGLEQENQFYGENIDLNTFTSSFDVYKQKKRLGKIHLQMPGIHNIYNALATITLGSFLGLKFNQIAQALKEFQGVKRRFELLGTSSGITFIDDYAHHPTEVRATLDTAKKGRWNRIICVFQPHRFSRTKFLKQEFGKAFTQADWVVLTNVYAAGEEPVPGVSGKSIVDAVLDHNPSKQVAYVPKKSEIKNFLFSLAEEGDLVLTVGAGDISDVAQESLGYLRPGLPG